MRTDTIWTGGVGRGLTGGRAVAWRVGSPVDASGETHDGRLFEGLADYKQILLSELRRFTRTLAEKLAIYATRRGVGFSDRDELGPDQRRGCTSWSRLPRPGTRGDAKRDLPVETGVLRGPRSYTWRSNNSEAEAALNQARHRDRGQPTDGRADPRMKKSGPMIAIW